MLSLDIYPTLFRSVTMLFFFLYRNFQTSTDAIRKQGTEMPSYWPRKMSRGRGKRHVRLPELTVRKHTCAHTRTWNGMHQSCHHSCGMMGSRDKRMRRKISHLELDTWKRPSLAFCYSGSSGRKDLDSTGWKWDVSEPDLWPLHTHACALTYPQHWCIQ